LTYTRPNSNAKVGLLAQNTASNGQAAITLIVGTDTAFIYLDSNNILQIAGADIFAHQRIIANDGIQFGDGSVQGSAVDISQAMYAGQILTWDNNAWRPFDYEKIHAMDNGIWADNATVSKNLNTWYDCVDTAYISNILTCGPEVTIGNGSPEGVSLNVTGNLQVSKGVRLINQGEELPECNESIYGMILFIGTGGTDPDECHMCILQSSGNYQWKKIF